MVSSRPLARTSHKFGRISVWLSSIERDLRFLPRPAGQVSAVLCLCALIPATAQAQTCEPADASGRPCIVAEPLESRQHAAGPDYRVRLRNRCTHVVLVTWNFGGRPQVTGHFAPGNRVLNCPSWIGCGSEFFYIAHYERSKHRCAARADQSRRSPALPAPRRNEAPPPPRPSYSIGDLKGHWHCSSSTHYPNGEAIQCHGALHITEGRGTSYTGYSEGRCHRQLHAGLVLRPGASMSFDVTHRISVQVVGATARIHGSGGDGINYGTYTHESALTARSLTYSGPTARGGGTVRSDCRR